MRPRDWKEPIQPRPRAARGGTTSAIGLPNRVTTTGLPVRWTRWRTDRHFALNFEIAMVSII